jgi:hypothetical protein
MYTSSPKARPCKTKIKEDFTLFINKSKKIINKTIRESILTRIAINPKTSEEYRKSLFSARKNCTKNATDMRIIEDWKIDIEAFED